MEGPLRKSARHPVALVFSLLALCAALPGSSSAAIRFQAPFFRQGAGGTDVGWPARLTVADLNGDGVPDVVDPASGGNALVLLGKGDGSFGSAIALPIQSGAPWSAVGDFDGDGNPDIASAAYPGESVFYGDGTGAQWQRLDIGPDYCEGVAAADFNKDDLADIAVVNAGPYELVVFLSRPGRTFQRIEVLRDTVTYAHCWGISPCDLNADGIPDLVMTGTLGGVDVIALIGRGDGTFEYRPLSDWLNYLEPRAFTVADVDRDGRPDLIVARYHSQVTIHPGNGDGTFGPARVIDLKPCRDTYDVAYTDANHDGFDDLVVGAADALLTLLGGPGGTFGPPIVSSMAVTPYPMTAADMNGDERPDIVSMMLGGGYGGADYGVAVALGDGSGRFGHQDLPLEVPITWGPLVGGDFNGDGQPDLVGANCGTDSLVILLNHGSRSFEPVRAARLGCPTTLRVADLDQDGKLDVVTHLSGVFAALRGNGDGTLKAPIYLTAAPLTVAHAFRVADVTGDGYPDLLEVSGPTLLVHAGIGDGSFAASSTVSIPDKTSDLAVGDLNGDGIMDLAGITDRNTGYEVLWSCTGQGDGSFSPPSQESVSGEGQSIAIADVDSDGRNDIVASCRAYSGCWSPTGCGDIVVRLQRPDGTLGPVVHGSWPIASGDVLGIQDVTADGLPDVVLMRNSGFDVIRNLGGGRFGGDECGYGGYLYPGGEAAVADFDGDGWPDFAASDQNSVLFTYGQDPLPPSAALVGPGPGVTLGVGVATDIVWNASDNVGVAGVDLFVSRHGRHGPFERIASGLPNSGNHSWTVTPPVSDSVAFKVVVFDSASNVAHAVSEGLLSIADVVGVGPDPSLPARLSIDGVAPNPSRGRLSIRMGVPRTGHVKLALFDLQGRAVANLLDGIQPAGSRTVEWDGSSSPRRLSAGIYFLRLTSNGESVQRRVALLK